MNDTIPLISTPFTGPTASTIPATRSTHPTLQAKKGGGIHHLIEQLGPVILEEQKKMTVSPISFESLRTKYEQISKENYVSIKATLSIEKDFMSGLRKRVTEVLTPGQINAFLQLINLTYEEGNLEHDEWYGQKHPVKQESLDRLAGLMTSVLIQNSYNAGYNDFCLMTANMKQADWLGVCLRGKPERKIQLRIIGDVDRDLGMHGSDVQFSVSGNVNYHLGLKAEWCEFIIEGELRDICPIGEKNCTYRRHPQTPLNTYQHTLLGEKEPTLYFVQAGMEKVWRLRQ